MITDKTCYIHLREQDDQGQVKHKGGATIAWYVCGDTDDIIIGRPAQCNTSDEFRRNIGRELALDNLQSKDPLAIVHSDIYAQLAVHNASKAMHFNALSPNGNSDLRFALQLLIEDKPAAMLSSAWYEALVRDIVTIKGNKIFLNGYKKAFQIGDPVSIYANSSN